MRSAEATVPTVWPDPRRPQADNLRILDGMEWSHRTPHLRAFSFGFSVRASEPSTGRYIEALFGAMAASDEAAHVYSFLEFDGRHEVYRDGEQVSSTEAASTALGHLLWDVNRNAITSARQDLLFHASAAEYEGRAVLMPAPMGSGKTTLVAGLVLGGLRYITDEAVAVDPTTLLVHPYPKPLALRRGSWEALPSLRPDLAPELRPFARSTWYVSPGMIRADAIASSPCAPGFVIAHRYEIGARTELTPMSRAEGLIALAENSFNITDFGTRRSMDLLAAIVRRCRCYRLTTGDLDAASRVVLDLVTSSEGFDG